MPFVHGKSTSVWLDSVNLSPYLRALGAFSVDVDAAETTAFQSAWKSFIAGSGGVKADFDGMYDPAQLNIRNTLGDDPGLTEGILSIQPNGGAAVGDMSRLIQVISTSYAESSPVGDVIGFKWQIIGNLAPGFGIVLHPFVEDTNTTTGADRDDGAATTTGWQAHLHVSAVDGGSWVVKLQDAATLPTYADVSGGAFAAKTGAGSERLVSASGATLRRFVRYIATRTGGSAGDGITFALTYARNV